MHHSKHSIYRLTSLPLALVGTSLLASHPLAFAAPLQVLIVGGGPTTASNQVAIESNVRYVSKLLPKQQSTTVLFADGDKNSATVVYHPEGKAKAPEEEILDSLLRPIGPRGRRPRNGSQTPNGSTAPNVSPALAPGSAPVGAGEGPPPSQVALAPVVVPPVQGAAPTPPAPVPPSPRALAQVPGSAGNLKAPNLTQLDGASKQENIANAFGVLSATKPSKQPVFLYFTGHGSKTKDNLENNYYNLWGGGKLTVQDLSQQVARLPKNDAVVLVMVQCFSGAFGNMLFEGGDPKGAQIDRDLVGFFAATKDRVAAGCTPAINEEYYRDFTSYFFAALTGRDRLDRKVAKDADFNKDGKIGLDEAFYWSVINDNSIDVPVATSDVFLERFSPLEGDAWVQTPYGSLLEWASPAQKASLIGLSAALELTGEDRIVQAQKIDFDARSRAFADQLRDVNQRFGAAFAEKRNAYLSAFPALTSTDAAAQSEARKQALAQIVSEFKEDKWKDFQSILVERNAIQEKNNGISVTSAKQLRFLRLAQKIVRDHNLRASNDAALKDRYMKLLKSEARTTLLPYQG